MDKLSVAILGSTGVVGKKFIDILKNHPWFKIDGLYASGSSNGKKITVDSVEKEVHLSDPELISRENFDLIFSAVSDEHSTILEKELRKRNQRVFTNASGNRMEKDVPLVVPELNYEKLMDIQHKKGYIVANGNCSTIGAILGSYPSFDYWENDMVITTLQAVSGAGYPGIPSLDIIGNVIPYIPKEEEKIRKETLKILEFKERENFNPGKFEISSTTTRVPVHSGHMISLSVRVKENVKEPEILQSFEEFKNGNILGNYPSLPEKSVELLKEIDRPQPALDCNFWDYKKEMAVRVGRVRLDKRRLSMIILVNNLVRGAAGASILNAEIVLKMEGLI